MNYNFKQSKVPVEGIAITANEGDKEIGKALIYIFENPNRGLKYGLLADVMIDPEYRGKGIGTELIQKTIDIAREAGCYKFVADSRFEREKVHKLYERFGFKKHGYGFRLDFEEVPEIQ